MGTFIEIQTDAFAGNLAIANQKLSYKGVRRPYRGIEIKNDTYGVIKVIKADGVEIPLTDAGGTRPQQSGSDSAAGSGIPAQNDKKSMASTYNYSNFIIQRLEESRVEKSQIVETFGDTFIFFFGERPRIINVTGVLMNTTDFNWRTEFWYNYENVLRGTKLVEQDARIYLFWDDLVVEGYMLQATARDDSESPYHIPFSFQLFVTNHTYLSTVGDDDYPVTHAVNLQPILQNTNIPDATNQLKALAKQKDEYISSVEDVRAAAEASEFARLDAAANDPLNTPAAKKFSAGKNLLLNAITLGLNAQNLTFLSIANHYFKNRKMRFPKGIAGAESYAGPPQYANEPNPFSAAPKRKLPYRSKIRDNKDEYIMSGPQSAALDEEAINRAEQDKLFKDWYTLEKQLLIDLAAETGLDPVQHPGGNPLERAHAIAAGSAIVATAIVRWGLPRIGVTPVAGLGL